MPGKYDADLAELQAIIQHGIDADRPDSTFGTALRQLLGDVPLGANSSQFATRKRFAMAQLLLKMFRAGGYFVVGALISAVCIWVGLSNWPPFWPPLLLGAGLLAVLYVAFGRPFVRSFVLYKGIRSLVQEHPDPGHELTFVPERELASQFANARLKSRVFGVLLMVASGAGGYLAYADHAHKPSEIPMPIFALPFVFFLGLGALISGINKPEMVYRKGYAQARWADYPFEIKLCLAIGLIASVLGLLWRKGWLVF